MRQILYRARTLKGLWEYGYVYPIIVEKENYPRWAIVDLEDVILPEGAGHYVINPTFEIDRNTAGQYTGKNLRGVKLFEGDIVKDSCGLTWVVEYSESECRFFLKRGKDIELSFMEETEYDKFQIIGNIHENPNQLSLINLNKDGKSE